MLLAGIASGLPATSLAFVRAPVGHGPAGAVTTAASTSRSPGSPSHSSPASLSQGSPASPSRPSSGSSSHSPSGISGGLSTSATTSAGSKSGRPSSGASGTPTASPAAAPVAFGFNDNAVAQGVATPAQDALFAQEAGATVERVTFDWRWAEPQPGVYNLSMYDSIYAALTARGIRPLWVPLFAPSWALSPATPCNQFTTDCRFPPRPSHFADYASMAALLARRYPKSAGIEVWNEPNLSYFWAPAPNAAAYESLLATTYQAVKTAAPTMPVVLGGLSDTQTTANANVPLVSFLRALYADGAAHYMDALSVHPYPGPGAVLSMVNTAMAQVRSVRAEAKDTNRPIWVTEVGVTRDGALLTNAQQASDLSWIYTTLSAQSDVKLIEFHTLIEPPTSNVSEQDYGLISDAFGLSDAFCTIATLRNSGFQCHQ